ncbi:MAG: rod shape-determining protein RodA [Clostridia bacterium]|nr:rod shape-determining protein RodA [Clostridia bacterium]
MRSILNSIADYIRECDKWLFLLCIAAGGYGSLAVLTATQHIGSNRKFLVQVFTVVLGTAVAIFISRFDYNIYKKLWPLIMGVCLFLVLLTFVIGFGPAGTDDKAWLMLPGGLTFQPSELLKIAFIITFSLHLEHLGENINKLKYLIPLLAHGFAPVLLIHLQGDDGTAIIFGVVMITMLFMAGLKLRYFVIFAAAVVVAAPLVYFLVLNPDQQARIQTMLDLESDLQGTGWQQWRGRIALANGGVWGQGLFKGELTQTGAVPEGHNDLIFVSIGEELGMVGCIAVLILLAAICLRILRIGDIAREKSGKLICVGVFAMLVSQIVVNLGMCLSITPVIGVTLPFFSAGGTSLVCLFCSIGVVMSIYMHRNARLMRIHD